MADDPERDLLPVKDKAPYDDVYTPHISKLDHKTLEDRYLRLLLDNEHLKKESHKQEEKIKRLATKLLRLLAEQKRDIPVTHRRTYNLDCVVMEQQQQIQELQQSNCHLQSKITVLRNQLAEHSSMHSASHCSNKLRSPSRSPARRTGSASSRAQVGVPSHDSQNMLQAHSNSLCLKSQDSPSHKVTQHCHLNKKNSEAPVDSTAIKQNQQLSQEVMRLNEEVRMLEQEMETQREQNSLRVAELEEELASKVANDERQKISKNVEIIQLQRSLQQQTAQLTANLAKIQVLEREVGHLQQELIASQQDNDELQCQLAKEHQKLIDNRHDLQKMETDRLSKRELEEQVRDLQNEKTALKDHNEHLLTLMSSRQKQSSEQGTTLRSQVTQLEDMLSDQRCECSRLKQELEEMKELSSQNRKSLEIEKDLQFQVKELESALAAEKQEKSNLIKFFSDMQVKVSEFKVQESQQHSDLENNLLTQITHLEAKLSEVLNERTEIAHNLKEEKEQVEALKITQNDLLQKLQDLQTRHSKIEEQLYIVRQVPKNSEEMTDQVKYIRTWPQGVSSRIPSLEESRSAHKIASAQPEGFNKDPEMSHSFTESSVSTSVVNENKSYAEAESEEGMLKSNVHNISLESESKGSEEAAEKSESSYISRSKKSEETMKKQIIDDIIKSILAKSVSKAFPESEKLSSEHEDTMDESLRMDISGLEPVNSDEVNSVAAAHDESRTDTANKIDICRELEKCRELLRVQYNLTSLYKKEVASLATRLNEKATEENKLINESWKKQGIIQSANINKLTSHLAPPMSEESQCSHLSIKPGEGVFEIHIQCLKLHPESLQNLTSHVDIPSLFLTWYFYNENMGYTSVKKVEKVIEFDSYFVCRVPLSDDFLDYLVEGKCIIEGHMTVEDASEPVARGTICFIELLEFPQNKIHSDISMVGINKHETIVDFGVIHCWYHLSCSLQIITDFIQKRNITDFKNLKIVGKNSSGSNQNLDSNMTLTTTKTKMSHTSRTVMASRSDEK